MPTWEETRRHLSRRFALTDEQADFVELYWSFPHGEQAVVQRQRVFHFVDESGSWVVIAAPVARGHLPAQIALEHNAKILVGALALEEGRYHVRYAAPLEALSLPLLDHLAQVVAREAAQLGALVRDPSDVAVHNAYCD